MVDSLTDPKNDWYAVLDVLPDAEQDTIHAAYRTLVKQHHPDKFHGKQTSIPHERMSTINQAYAVLSDATQRARYDRRCRQQQTSGGKPKTVAQHVGGWVNRIPWWGWLTLWFLIAPRLLRILMVTTVGQFLLAGATIFVFWRLMPKRPVN